MLFRVLGDPDLVSVWLWITPIATEGVLEFKTSIANMSAFPTWITGKTHIQTGKLTLLRKKY